MKIRCQKAVTLPPNTVQYVTGKLDHPTAVNYQGLTEPYCNTMLATGVLMANAIVYTDRRIMPIQCINGTENPITLHKGKLLGFLKPLDMGEKIHDVRQVGVRDQPYHDSYSKQNQDVQSYDNNPISAEGWTKTKLFEELRLDEIQATLNGDEL